MFKQQIPEILTLVHLKETYGYVKELVSSLIREITNYHDTISLTDPVLSPSKAF